MRNNIAFINSSLHCPLIRLARCLYRLRTALWHNGRKVYRNKLKLVMKTEDSSQSRTPMSTSSSTSNGTSVVSFAVMIGGHVYITRFNGLTYTDTIQGWNDMEWCSLFRSPPRS
eukprot:2088892-Pyramimonas_sp.AAC.1